MTITTYKFLLNIFKFLNSKSCIKKKEKAIKPLSMHKACVEDMSVKLCNASTNK